jgi:hypothetical protein
MGVGCPKRIQEQARTGIEGRMIYLEEDLSVDAHSFSKAHRAR